MVKPGKWKPVISALLLTTVSYVVFVYLPAVNGTRLIGFTGHYADGRFVVARVFDDSPAAEAGVRKGDVVISQGGRETKAWHREHGQTLAVYLQARYRLHESALDYDIERDGKTIQTRLMPRALSAAETVNHFGVRTLLIVFLVGLVVVILTSRTREKTAFLICVGFCVLVIWLASDRPFWPEFYVPLISGIPIALVPAVDLLEFLSLQAVMGVLLHIALKFPEDQPMLIRYSWLPISAYLIPLVVPLLAMVVGSGELLHRISGVYPIRLWLNTFLLIVAALLMLDSYRRCQSPAKRERTRWVIVSIAVVAVAHLVLWNLPYLILGGPLVPSYNWLLATIALIPATMTLAINNHELFGIRGIIRSRIKLLDTLLERERSMVGHRDRKIHEFANEIRQLKEELEEYSENEESIKTSQNNLPTIAKLEKQYSFLKEIRQEQLVSLSPKWEPVFEQMVLAARGGMPVMIVGESGTGKTAIAWTICQLSERRAQVYREISCSQFEHADPAFALGRFFGIGQGHGLHNVAREGRAGLLEECEGGTLFLDDFDRLPLNVQDLFLFPLEGKPFEPAIGTGPMRTTSVKFIFATNRNPETLVAEGRFRSDVLARIGLCVDIPPLRDRPEDIAVLAQHFVREIGEEMDYEISVVSPKAINILRRYPYASGNARELRAEIHRAIGKALLEDDHVLRAGYLSEKLRSSVMDNVADVATERQKESSTLIQNHEQLLHRPTVTETTELAVLRKHKFQIKPAEEELGLSHKSKTLSNHLRGICLQALEANDWDEEQAARSVIGRDDPRSVVKVVRKMRRYLKSIEENIGTRTELRLYNNLPAIFHDSLTGAIARARKTSD